ncbi:hypothetical protein GCAAIG_03440 [Candidatus Electronema halotolerans]
MKTDAEQQSGLLPSSRLVSEKLMDGKVLMDNLMEVRQLPTASRPHQRGAGPWSGSGRIAGHHAEAGPKERRGSRSALSCLLWSVNLVTFCVGEVVQNCLRLYCACNLLLINGKMTEIKDLAGLSEPMTKLIEVVEKGVGQLFKPWQIKRIADAKAYEIERVAPALENHSNAFNVLEYDGEKVKLLCEQRQGIPPEAAQELIALHERAVSRLTHRELRRQHNIEKAVHYAMNEIFQEETVSAEPVDEDWIARFFNIVEDVSNEQMQQLWGRILAGEVKRPKSFSLRTMEALRNISQKEAEVFQKVAMYAVLTLDNMAFILNDHEILSKTNTVDLLVLRNTGLLSVSDNILLNIGKTSKMMYLIYGGKIIICKRHEKYRPLNIPIIPFTEVGSELIRLVKERFDYEYMEKLLEEISTTGWISNKAAIETQELSKAGKDIDISNCAEYKYIITK